MGRSRTNVEIEVDYVQTIMTRYGLRAETDAVELALRYLAGQPMSRVEALRMRGARAIDEPPATTPLAARMIPADTTVLVEYDRAPAVGSTDV